MVGRNLIILASLLLAIGLAVGCSESPTEPVYNGAGQLSDYETDGRQRGTGSAVFDGGTDTVPEDTGGPEDCDTCDPCPSACP